MCVYICTSAISHVSTNTTAVGFTPAIDWNWTVGEEIGIFQPTISDPTAVLCPPP